MLQHWLLLVLLPLGLSGEVGSVSRRSVVPIIAWPIYINLRLYYDEKLLAKLGNSEAEVHYFLLAVVHSVYLTYNNKPLSYVARWHFVVQSIELLDHKYVNIGPDQDGNQYRQLMGMHYQAQLQFNGVIYTSLVLFTGHNFRYDHRLSHAIGLANPSSACTGPHTKGSQAIIVEARSYRVASILAHELGHALGLEHDENLLCGSEHLMSALASGTFGGKTKFSHCSKRVLQDIFTRIFHKAEKGFDSYRAKCFQHWSFSNPVAVFPGNSSQSYQSVSASRQCRCLLGHGFEAQADSGSGNICNRLQCTNHLVNVFAHPAIENTPCAPGKYCRAGKCR